MLPPRIPPPAPPSRVVSWGLEGSEIQGRAKAKQTTKRLKFQKPSRTHLRRLTMSVAAPIDLKLGVRAARPGARRVSGPWLRRARLIRRLIRSQKSRRRLIGHSISASGVRAPSTTQTPKNAFKALVSPCFNVVCGGWGCWVWRAGRRQFPMPIVSWFITLSSLVTCRARHLIAGLKAADNKLDHEIGLDRRGSFLSPDC